MIEMNIKKLEEKRMNIEEESKEKWRRDHDIPDSDDIRAPQDSETGEKRARALSTMEADRAAKRR